MAPRARPGRRLLLALIASSAASAQESLLLSPAQTADLGMTAPLQLSRFNNAQPDLDGSVPYTVTTDSDAGGFETFAEDPNGITARWTSSFTEQIADGQSQSAPFFYRGAVPGLHTLTVSGGGAAPGVAQINVTRWVMAVDFESTLRLADSPPGPVNAEFNNATTITCEIADGGALRGNGALLLDDNNVSDLQASRVHAILPTRESFWFRAWHREVVPPGNAGGSWTIFELEGFNNIDPLIINDSKELVSFGLRPGQLQILVGKTPTDQQVAIMRPVAGLWHLYEAQVLGLGTAAASAHWAIDGVEGQPFEGLDWSPVDRALCDVAFGGVFRSGSGSTPSQLWTDDLAVALDPLASRVELNLTGSPMVPVGSCVPVTLSGVSTFDGGAAQSPFDLQVSVIVTIGSAGLFGDAACQQPTAFVTLPRGALQQTAWVKPSSEGPLVLHAIGASLLTGGPFLLVAFDGGSMSPDGGSDAGPSDAGVAPDAGGGSDGGSRSDGGTGPALSLYVGCGCDGAPALAGAVLLMLALTRRARASRRGSPRSPR